MMTKSTSQSFRLHNGLAANVGRCLAAAITALLLWNAPAAATTAGISVSKPWMRFVIRTRPAAGYFTLHNDTGTPITLVGASARACGMTMLHQSRNVNGVEKMLPVKSIAVPAHGTISFAPGGYHIMCMSPGATITVGAKVPITLKFANGETVTAQFAVHGPGGK
jgi:periplasmic copper chaperone A